MVGLGFSVKLHLCLGPRNAGENINGAVLLGTSQLRLRNESRHSPNELPHISWSICAARRGWVLFVWVFKKKATERQKSSPVISQVVKHSRRHFCSDSIKGLPPYPPLCLRSLPAPSDEGWHLIATLTSRTKAAKLIPRLKSLYLNLAF